MCPTIPTKLVGYPVHVRGAQHYGVWVETGGAETLCVWVAARNRATARALVARACQLAQPGKALPQELRRLLQKVQPANVIS